MKHFTFRMAVAALTFLLGLAAVSLFLFPQSYTFQARRGFPQYFQPLCKDVAVLVDEPIHPLLRLRAKPPTCTEASRVEIEYMVENTSDKEIKQYVVHRIAGYEGGLAVDTGEVMQGAHLRPGQTQTGIYTFIVNGEDVGRKGDGMLKKVVFRVGEVNFSDGSLWNR